MTPFMILIFLLIFLAAVLLLVYYSVETSTQNTNLLIQNFNQNHKLATKVSNIQPSINRIRYPVLYLNLDDNIHRKEFMERQFEKNQVEFKRISAIYGKKYNFRGDQLDDGTKFVNTYSINPSELGCTLTHLKAIKYAFDQGYQMVVIMEDDISLNLMPFWKNDLPDLVQKLPKNWKIFQLFHHCNYQNGPEIRSFKEINCYGAAAYLINRAGMATILNKCFRNNTFYLKGCRLGGADEFIYECVNDVYIYHIPLFYTYNGTEEMESQLHPLHTPKHITTSSSIIKMYVTYGIYIWKGCAGYFMDVAKIFQEALGSKGFLSELINQIPPKNTYHKIIVFGANNCQNHNVSLPENIVLVNMEQLYDESPWLNSKYRELLGKHEVWDYNQDNIKWLKRNLQKDAKLFQLGLCHTLRYNKRSTIEDIDVLFYGAFNDRRTQIYQKLKSKGINVIFRDDLWGEEKEEFIDRAKIILNLHYFPTGRFELVRVLPLLINGKFILTETSSNMDEYSSIHSGLATSNYDQIVDTVLYYLDHPMERKRIAQQGQQIIKTIPTVLPL